MKVLVPIKRVVDPYVKLHLNSATTVDIEHVKKVTNPFDEIALEEALRFKEKGMVSSVTLVTIGSKASNENLRAGLAMGADDAFHFVTDLSLEPLHIAKTLCSFVKEHGFDIVVMGKQAIDDDCNQVGQMLGACLDWPVVCFASKIDWSTATLTIESEVDEGIQVQVAPWPLVITVDLRLNEPRYPTLPNIMKAKQKPLTTLSISTDIVKLDFSNERLGLAAPPRRKQAIILESTKDLVEILKDKEHVL